MANLTFRLCTFIVIIIALVGAGRLSPAQECTASRVSEVAVTRNAELTEIGQLLVTSIKINATDRILAMMVEDGFGFEESKRFSKQEVTAMFEEKRGVYCYFFDPTCIPGEVAQGSGWYSFHEVLTHASKVWFRAFLSGDRTCSQVRLGEVVIKWEGGPVEDPLGGVHFVFIYQDGKWNLSGFSHGLKGPRQN